MIADDLSQLAAEHALGLLEGDDRARARALIADNGEFAGEVALWTGRFAPMLDGIGPQAPPSRTFDAIERQIDAAGIAAGSVGDRDNVILLRRRADRWRGFAGISTALAAALALILVTRPPTPEPRVPAPVPEGPAPSAPQPQQPAPEAPATPVVPEAPEAPEPGLAPLVAKMAADDSDALLIATWDRSGRSLVVAAAAGIAPVSGRSHQLWVIPAGGKPQSIGLLPATRPLHLQLESDLARQLQSGATLAVSVEPSGGSPTGQPTGPVIAAGPLQQT